MNEYTYLGLNQSNEKVFMIKPKWLVDGYWSFGLIGNGNFVTHLKAVDINTYFKEFVVQDKLCLFSKLVQSIYSLRDLALELTQSNELTNEINIILIPQLIDELYKVIQYENYNRLNPSNSYK